MAHLDPEGLRYYLPALMLWLLDMYDREEERSWVDMTVIGTLSAIAPYDDFRRRMPSIFDAFSDQQKAAIASYLDALPGLVALDQEDTVLIDRAMEFYWRQYVPTRGFG